MQPDFLPSVRPTDVTDGHYLVDVREPQEWDAGHVDGSVHVPMSELPARASDIPREREVVLVCRVGARSAQVAAWLNQQGWRCRNLEGGLVEWERAGRPLVADGDTVPHLA